MSQRGHSVEDVKRAVELIKIYDFVVGLQMMLGLPGDTRDKTVIDLLDDDIRHFEPYPVGRLDKDTVGLLLLTNDGALTHRLLSPNKDVPKVYFAKATPPILFTSASGKN